MAGTLDVARVQFFAPAEPVLDVSQVTFEAPGPPNPSTIPYLDVAQVRLAAPSPPLPSFLDIAQVTLRAPQPPGEAPYSGIRVARDGNLHNVSLQIAKGGTL
jgi:hypothetical protein